MILMLLFMLLQTPVTSIDQTTWIVGQWSMKEGKKTVEEYWSAWEGQRFNGRSVVKTDDKIMTREERSIERSADGSVLLRLGTDKKSVIVMKLVKSGPNELVFESVKKTDAVRRISYSSPNEGTLIVRTERTVRGTPSITEQQFTKQVADPI